MLQNLLHWMGYGLCHQLPERSFFGGGVQVPVCARDTGIYVGFALSFLILSLIHRGRRPAGFPTWPVWLIMAGLLGAMGWDGVSSYAGLRGTTNDIRLITGLGVGFSAAAVVFPMLHDELWRRRSAERVLYPAWRLMIWLACIPLSFGVIRFVAPAFGLAYPVITAASILFTLTMINLIIVAMLPAFDRKGESLNHLIVPVALAAGLGVIEIAAAGLVRQLLEGLAR